MNRGRQQPQSTSLLGVVLRASRKDVLRSVPFMPIYSAAEVVLAFLAAAMLRLIYIDTPRIFVGDLLPKNIQAIMSFPQSLDRKDLAFVVPLLIVAVGFIKLVTSFLSTYFMERAGYFVSTVLREELLETLLRARPEWLQQANAAEVSSKIMADSAMMQSAVSKGILGGARDLLVLIFCTIGMFVVASDIVLVILACIVPFALLIRYFARVLQRHITMYRRSVIELSSHALDSRMGLLTLAAERTTTQRLDDFREKTALLRKTTAKTMKMRVLSGPFVEYLAVLGIAVLLSFKNNLSSADIAAYASLFILGAMTYRPLKNLSGVINQFAEVKLTYERLNGIWLGDGMSKGEPARSAQAAPIPPGTPADLIDHDFLCSVRKVTYRTATGQALLEDFDFSLRPGELVAFAGDSGSGKSTALRLLAGVLQPHSGTIQTVPRVRLATQAATVFAGTVADNICYHNRLDESVLRDIVCALGLANTSLGAGLFLSRSIGPSGEGLSGGERARVALARVFAVMRDAVDKREPLLALFDEPTANLDADSAERFWLLLRLSVASGVTVGAVFVSHHAPDLRHSSRWYRFAAGRVSPGVEPSRGD